VEGRDLRARWVGFVGGVVDGDVERRGNRERERAFGEVGSVIRRTW